MIQSAWELACNGDYALNRQASTLGGAFELVTDGREVTHAERGHLTVSTLRWDQDALVSTDRSEQDSLSLRIARCGTSPFEKARAQEYPWR